MYQATGSSSWTETDVDISHTKSLTINLSIFKTVWTFPEIARGLRLRPFYFFMTDLGDKLEGLGLSQYLHALISEGFDTWETVLDITESDL
jgi:hypothetical protein